MNISTSFRAAGCGAFAIHIGAARRFVHSRQSEPDKKFELRHHWRSSIAVFNLENGLFVPECDPAFAQVVRRHFDVDFIAWNDANSIFPHLTFGPRDDFVLVFKFDPIHRIRQQFGNRAGKLKQFFFCHIINLVVNSAAVVPVTA
jgi:hypothetical protein